MLACFILTIYLAEDTVEPIMMAAMTTITVTGGVIAAATDMAVIAIIAEGTIKLFSSLKHRQKSCYPYANLFNKSDMK
jgi:hypothetical protein